MLARVWAVAAFCATLAGAQDLGTGRDMLFSNPGAELPDVYVSESVLFVQESADEATTYTVVLTHPPGMREDETIDLDNDEVRIYLTSSQEHFQQDDTDGTEEYGVFEERRNHRTQLIIHTSDINNDATRDVAATLDAAHFGLPGATKAWMESDKGTIGASGAAAAGSTIETDGPAGAAMPLGPLPYIYKTYSTVGGNIPEQQSPLDSTDPAAPQIMVVCPVCTHPAFCVLYDGEIGRAHV